jgi:hypothetical protein
VNAPCGTRRRRGRFLLGHRPVSNGLMIKKPSCVCSAGGFRFLYAVVEKLSIGLTILRGSLHPTSYMHGRFNRQVIDSPAAYRTALTNDMTEHSSAGQSPATPAEIAMVQIRRGFRKEIRCRVQQKYNTPRNCDRVVRLTRLCGSDALVRFCVGGKSQCRQRRLTVKRQRGAIP